MENFEYKTLVTSPLNLTYSYYVEKDLESNLAPDAPTLMILHGFPDDAYMWERTLPVLTKLPFPIILVEILGLGGSSKSTNPDHFRYVHQTNSINQILDRENIEKVIPIGHDWGSDTSQRFYLYHRERCLGLVLLSLAYKIPSARAFDLDNENEKMVERLGYPQWEYWKFFTAPDAPKLMEQNMERFYEVMNGELIQDLDGEKRDVWMREMFCVKDGMRDYIAGTGKYKDFTVPLRKYAQDEKLKKTYCDRLRKSGMSSPVQYYVALRNNIMLEDEKKITGEKRRIDVPLLYIGMEDDHVCRTDLMIDAKQKGLVKNLEEKKIKGNDWILYEQEASEEVAGLISNWLQRRFLAK